jgi:hypothetical protein
VSGEISSTAVYRAFGGEQRRFELRLGEIKHLEQQTGCGIGDIYRRLLALAFKIEDVRQVVKFGLIGGGVPEIDAEAMVRAGVDGFPISEPYELAKDIMIACFIGAAPGKAKGPSDQDAPATSAPSTSPERPPGSDRAKSKPGRSRSSKRS